MQRSLRARTSRTGFSISPPGLRDALILSLPNQIVCSKDCAGLCPYCGESLNGADPAAHDHGQDIDPRWSKLRELG